MIKTTLFEKKKNTFVRHWKFKNTRSLLQILQHAQNSLQAFQNPIWGITKKLKHVEKSIIWTYDITFLEYHKERSSKA